MLKPGDIYIFEAKENINAEEFVNAEKLGRRISPHWPNIGNYIGETEFECGALIGEKGTIFIREKEYQKRRVYQDELDYFNKESAK